MSSPQSSLTSFDFYGNATTGQVQVNVPEISSGGFTARRSAVGEESPGAEKARPAGSKVVALAATLMAARR